MQTFGVLGNPLQHTLSPQLHGLIYKELGMEAVYNRYELPPELVPNMVPAMKMLGIKGINVTMPYKQTIMEYIDEVSLEAQKLGAVNTVHLLDDGKSVGYNTDYYGFLMQLGRFDVPIKNQRFVICGMSGAGKAIYHAMLDNGAAEVVFASRSPEKGVSYDRLKTIKGFDTIINCTPLGMYPEVEGCIVDEQVLSRFTNAVDIVYNPYDTLFLKRARSLGMKAVGGLYMFIFQGIRSFEIWTGKTVSQEAGDRIFEELNKKFI